MDKDHPDFPRVVILTKRSVMAGAPFAESLIQAHNVAGIFAEDRATRLTRSKWRYAINRVKEHGVLRLMSFVLKAAHQKYIARECIETVAARHPSIPFFPVESINDSETLAQIRSCKPDIICIGATRLFCEEGLSIPPLGCLNIHGAMLPRNAGMEPTFWALYNEEFTAIGETIHFAVPKADAGNIVMQERIPFTLGETVEEINDRIIRRGAEMIPEAVSKVASGDYEFPPMDMSNYLYNGRPSLEQRRELQEKIQAWRATWGGEKPEPSYWE